MSAVLWVNIDNYFKTNILADMGSGGLYSTLLVKEVLLSDSFKPEKYNPPAVAILSNIVRPISQGPHGDGKVHIYSEYPYWLACVDNEQMTYATAKANAQILVQRLRNFVLTRFALGGLTSTFVETVYETEILDWGVEVLGGNVGGNYKGVGALRLIVRTET
ncbi:MAG: hypothetical protein DDT21_01842 [Syntrophomonadaceae bacterium]|nr:hypothetical protein [Bacillota bacterium]